MAPGLRQVKAVTHQQPGSAASALSAFCGFPQAPRVLGWGDGGELSLAGEDRADLQTSCLQGRKILEKPWAAKSQLKNSQPMTTERTQPKTLPQLHLCA